MSFLRRSIVFTLSAVLLLSCGKQRKAEGVVRDFIAANAVSEGYAVDCTPVDSTGYITAERISALRTAASADPLFKRGAKLAPLPAANKYAYTRATLVNGTDTIVRTFYLDMALTGVVAFKEN